MIMLCCPGEQKQRRIVTHKARPSLTLATYSIGDDIGMWSIGGKPVMAIELVGVSTTSMCWGLFSRIWRGRLPTAHAQWSNGTTYPNSGFLSHLTRRLPVLHTEVGTRAGYRGSGSQAPASGYVPSQDPWLEAPGVAASLRARLKQCGDHAPLL